MKMVAPSSMKHGRWSSPGQLEWEPSEPYQVPRSIFPARLAGLSHQSCTEHSLRSQWSLNVYAMSHTPLRLYVICFSWWTFISWADGFFFFSTTMARTYTLHVTT